MATRKPKTADPVIGGTNTEARALVDLPAFGVLSGGHLIADAQTIAELSATGSVDTHPDAVAHAKGQKDAP